MQPPRFGAFKTHSSHTLKDSRYAGECCYRRHRNTRAIRLHFQVYDAVWDSMAIQIVRSIGEGSWFADHRLRSIRIPHDFGEREFVLFMQAGGPAT
jgi:hypothetical protein